MSEQDNTILALQLQMQDNAKKLDQLRAANKKLRAESKSANAAVSEYRKHAFADYARLCEWKAAHRQLAEAIGSKAER